MKIALGCDHGGICLKNNILELLKSRNIEVVDFGTYDETSVDYPDYALKVAEAVASKQCDKGILLCGTGIGIGIAANKVKGIRAATAHDAFTAEMVKMHNNANIICLGGRIVTPEQSAEYVGIWLDTEFAGGRHENRINKITEIENKYMK